MVSKKILWADDEISQLKPHILFLEKKGYEVTAVNSGEDAIEECKKNHDFDLILMDEMMTGLDGLSTISIIKKDWPNIPIVMITKNEEEWLMEEAIGAHISNYLTKPVNPSQILMVCKKIFDNKKIQTDKNIRSFIKIPQIYAVLVGDQVEIGACTTIDRGALDNTVIGTGCKIDNHVQIAHGVKIGKHTVISGCTGISGSTKIGEYCLIGGGVGIVDNIEIADQVEITGMSLVNRSIKEKGRYSSGTIMMPGADWKRNAITQTKLYEMSKRLRKIEKKIAE